MPTYDYECKKCGHSFEAFQSMSDEPLTECPECGGEVRRLIGGGLGIIFKGNGFYVTDNRSGSAPSTSSSSSEKKDTESADKSSDTKKGADSGNKSTGKEKVKS